MELSWHWPWVGLAGLIASLAVIAIMVLASAKRRHNDSGSVRTFSLDDDLNTETASRLFRQWRTMSRAAVVLLVMALVLAIALVARPSTVDEGEERASSRDIVLCLDVSGSALPYDREVIDTYRTLVARLLIAFVFPFKSPRKAMVGMSVLCTIFYVLLVMAHTQVMAIVLLFAFAFSMAGLNPTAVASAGRMTSVTSMGIMLPAASSGAILMPWIIGIVAEKAGLAAGMASNIVPCVGLIIFTLLVAKLPEE